MGGLTQDQLETLVERSRNRPATAVNGVVRLDVDDEGRVDSWYLTITRGKLAVSHEGGKADCVITGDLATFDAILSGKANAMAALLRGALVVQDKVVLLTALQGLFLGSPGSEKLPAAGYAERRS